MPGGVNASGAKAGGVNAGGVNAGEHPVLDAIARQPAATRLPVEMMEYRPHSMVFRADCPADGWLLATDRWAPGWRVQVNGQTATLWGGMFLFRAVEVKAGLNEIHFTYAPWWHPWTVLVSYATLGLVAAGCCASVVRAQIRSR